MMCDKMESSSNGYQNDDDLIDMNNVFVNPSDGLPPNSDTLDRNPNHFELDDSMEEDVAEESDILKDKDLPSSLIITGLDTSFFNSHDEKMFLENVFKLFDPNAEFLYMKSFKRVRVNYTSSYAAAQARVQIHETRIGEKIIHCYFAQSVSETTKDDFLHPPALKKQFLISPPCSPPVGWEPVDEAEPLINYDLLAAVGSLDPGGIHELHRGTNNQPDIVLCGCDETPKPLNEAKPAIVQTRCPDRAP